MKEYIYLIAPIGGWVVAQGIKFGLTLRKDGITLSDAVQSGGMPSSHSAFMVALTTVVGLETGITSAIFGVSFAVTAVVLYDALGVRRATGQQTIAISELAQKQKLTLKTNIENAKGHSVPEVIGGVIVGIVVGASAYNFL